MKRLALCLAAVLILAGMVPAAVSATEPLQAPPTNTKRPTTISAPVTNTRVVTLTPSKSPTNTRTFTATASPTRTPTNTRTPTLTPTITPTTVGPYIYPDNINSLTGLPYPSEEARNRRNLIVKVSNYPWVVRPQAGLSKADVVFEYEVEGGVTRFAAIYRSQGADMVGSVRSARLPDLELVIMYQALLAYSGANDNIKKMIGEADWKYQALTPQFGDNCPPFCRFPRTGLPFEHTLFGNTFQMWDLATRRKVNTGYPARGFAFDPQPDPSGKPANDIFIKWYHDQDARWQYNPSDARYYRWNTGIPHIDLASGQQLSADNIVIIQANHKPRPDIYESETKSPTLEIELWGGDRAWVFRDGQWYQGYWLRQNRERAGAAGADVRRQQDTDETQAR
jgi:hypothetical protein